MSRTIKRHDTLDPLTGIVRTDGVRQNLSVFDTIVVHYKVADAGTFIEVEAEDVEDIDGAGTPGPLNAEDGLPENRGKWRAPLADADVDTAGEYELELECTTAAGKKVHFPSRRADNETLTIDPDVDDA
jgi:hypothetical protein